MSKIKSMTLAALLALGIAVGGVGLAAPASAAANTVTVIGRVNEPNVAYAVYVYRTNGDNHWLRVGNSETSVWKVCPYGYNRLWFRAPNGKSGIRSPGECIVFSLQGPYDIAIYPAS